MSLHFLISGYTLIFLGLVHIGFPKYFSWKDELKSLSLINRQMTKVHTFFIALLLILFGLLNIFEHLTLQNTALGKTICLGMAFFWLTRLIFQFFVYSPKLWRGKRFETLMHILFTSLWIYLITIYSLSYLSY
jgi:hypothetical protein